jgi:hypothetical protein
MKRRQMRTLLNTNFRIVGNSEIEIGLVISFRVARDSGTIDKVADVF